VGTRKFAPCVRVCKGLEFGVNMDRDCVSFPNVESKRSVGRNGHSRPGAASTVLHTIDNIAILSSREARLETRVPTLIRVIDRYESGLPTSKRHTLGSRREPVRHLVGLSSVPEPDHSGDCSPTVLAVPTVRPTVSVASAVVPVWSALVGVVELVTGQDCRRAPRMG
jgi:hypothetical protein